MKNKKLYKKYLLNYCPNCGKELEKDRGTQCPLLEPIPDIDIFWGFDVYCVKCNWSGDIRPDKDIEDECH
jgi:hypothetical protein